MTKEFDRLVGAGALSERYDAALSFAANAHRRQLRKSGNIPYLTHVLRVSALTLEYGADEETAIAALLHDCAEDCGGRAMLDRIGIEFGERVSEMVEAVSDSLAEDPSRKAPWRERKERYLRGLAEATVGALLIAACDKIENAASMVRTLRGASPEERADFMSRFKGGLEGMEWYYRSVLGLVESRNLACVAELRDSVEAMLKEIRSVAK